MTRKILPILLVCLATLSAALVTSAQAPVGLPAGSPPAKVNLSWTASATPAAQLAGYDVFRATTAGGESGTSALNGTSPIAGTSYIDSTAIGGTTYFYTVSAQGTVALGSKLSAFSNEITVVVPTNPVPPVLGIATFSISKGANNTKIIVASYKEQTPGVQTAYQLWSGTTLLKYGTPALSADGTYSFKWTVKKANAANPSFTIEDAAGNISTSIAE
jgi:hypothetical protein